MLVNGYGEFEGVRKAVQKDELAKKPVAGAAAAASPAAPVATDRADVSNAARVYQMRDKALDKVKQIPDPREVRIQEVLDQMGRGTLMTPDAVKESIGKMVDRGILG